MCRAATAEGPGHERLGQQPGNEIRAGDKVGHRYKPGRVGHVVEVFQRGRAVLTTRGCYTEIDRVAWVTWEGQTERVAEPIPNLIKWA